MQGGKKHEVVPSFSSSQELSQEQSMDVDAQKGWEGQGTVSNPFEMSSEVSSLITMSANLPPDIWMKNVLTVIRRPIRYNM